MKRFFGMMPVSEIEKRATYLDRYEDEVIIEAGPNGWSVIYVDGSTSYKDEQLTTEENFRNAYAAADAVVGPLTKRTRKEKVDYDG